MGARMISLLVEEWEFPAGNGRGAYEKAGSAGWLRWQLFVVQMEWLLASECRRR